MAILTGKQKDLVQMCVPIVVVLFAIFTSLFINKNQLEIIPTNISQVSHIKPLNQNDQVNEKLFGVLSQNFLIGYVTTCACNILSDYLILRLGARKNVTLLGIFHLFFSIFSPYLLKNYQLLFRILNFAYASLFNSCWFFVSRAVSPKSETQECVVYFIVYFSIFKIGQLLSVGLNFLTYYNDNLGFTFVKILYSIMFLIATYFLDWMCDSTENNEKSQPTCTDSNCYQLKIKASERQFQFFYFAQTIQTGLYAVFCSNILVWRIANTDTFNNFQLGQFMFFNALASCFGIFIGTIAFLFLIWKTKIQLYIIMIIINLLLILSYLISWTQLGVVLFDDLVKKYLENFALTIFLRIIIQFTGVCINSLTLLTVMQSSEAKSSWIGRTKNVVRYTLYPLAYYNTDLLSPEWQLILLCASSVLLCLSYWQLFEWDSFKAKLWNWNFGRRAKIYSIPSENIPLQTWN